MAFGGLLGVGVPANEGSAADQMKGDLPDERLGGQFGLESEAGQLKGAIVERGETVHDKPLSIEDTDYAVKGQDSKEIRLHIDEITPQTGNIRQTDPRSDGTRRRSDIA